MPKTNVNEMSVEELKARILELETRKAGKLSLKVAAKGGLSVYGLGRFPLTLYKSQWVALLGIAKEIQAFMGEHDSELKEKE